MNCPWCGSHTNQAESLLGRLGCLLWFRCRWCGGQWSRPAKEKRLRKDGVIL
jgi:hypothetical protein